VDSFRTIHAPRDPAWRYHFFFGEISPFRDDECSALFYKKAAFRMQGFLRAKSGAVGSVFDLEPTPVWIAQSCGSTRDRFAHGISRMVRVHFVQLYTAFIFTPGPDLTRSMNAGTDGAAWPTTLAAGGRAKALRAMVTNKEVNFSFQTR
jgi:hypothetical protein